MKANEIRDLVNEGFELNRQLRAIEERLDAITARLKEEAGEEKKTFVGDGCQALVFQGRGLLKVIDDERVIEKLRKLCDGSFEALFKFTPVQKFKDVAAALLGKDSARAGKVLELVQGEPYRSCRFSEIK